MTDLVEEIVLEILLVLALTFAITSCTQDQNRVQVPISSLPSGPVAKYRTPNEFTMSDGCVVRSKYKELRKVAGDYVWLYFNHMSANDWTKECSMAKEAYREDEIVGAKY